MKMKAKIGFRFFKIFTFLFVTVDTNWREVGQENIEVVHSYISL